MISIIRNRKEIGIKDFVCDKAEELSDIDIRTAAMGSTCFVIDENVTYMLNGKKIWIPVSNGSGANPGGGSDVTFVPISNEEIDAICAEEADNSEEEPEENPGE